MTETNSENEIPKVTDLLDESQILRSLDHANGFAAAAVGRFFKKGARKAPITKTNLHRYCASAVVMGQMQSIESLMNFLENAEVIDGYDPNHDFVQALYGELCLYLLKLDKYLFAHFGIKSNVNKISIERRTQNYLNKYFKRQEKIEELQRLLNNDSPQVN